MESSSGSPNISKSRSQAFGFARSAGAEGRTGAGPSEAKGPAPGAASSSESSSGRPALASGLSIGGTGRSLTPSCSSAEDPAEASTAFNAAATPPGATAANEANGEEGVAAASLALPEAEEE